MSVPTPHFRSPDRCEYRHDSGLRLLFDMITPTSRGLDAWCEIRYQNGQGPQRVLTYGRYDLMGSRTVSSLSNQAGGEDRREVISAAVYDCVQFILNGSEPLQLSKVKPRPRSERWLIEPFIETQAPTRLIAPGGTGKSLFALALAVAVSCGSRSVLGLLPRITGPVLYLDWEADETVHAERLQAICLGAGIKPPDNIHYLLQRQPLHRSARGLLRLVNDLSPLLVVVDSNTMARGPSGEGSAEDSTTRLFGVLRSFGVASLIVDHKSKDAMQKGRSGGYSSIFNENLARLQWEVARSVELPTGSEMVWRLEKANNTRRGREVGYRQLYFEDQITFTQIPPSEVGTPSDTNSKATDSIYMALAASHEPRTVRSVAAELDMTPEAVRARLSEHPSLFENVGTKAEGRWRLRDRPGDEGQSDSLPDPY